MSILELGSKQQHHEKIALWYQDARETVKEYTAFITKAWLAACVVLPGKVT